MSDPILIWGAGAVGGTLGAYMARAGEDVVMVDIVAEHVAAMNKDGLTLEGPVEAFNQPMRAFTPGQLKGKFRRIILAVKGHHTEGAVAALTPFLADDGFVLSAQNGLNEVTIAEMIGANRTMGCFVNFGADWLEPGKILLGNRAAVAVGELDGSTTARLKDMHRLLSIFEPRAVMTDNIWGYLWGKLGYGAILFATALTNGSMTENLESAKHFPVFDRLGREVVATALKRGQTPLGFNGFNPDAFTADASPDMSRASVAAMAEHNRYTAKTHSGIWRDLAVRKRKTEVDAQIAPIVQLAKEVGIDTPVLAKLVDLIHAIEDGKTSQDWATLDALLEACTISPVAAS